jgi:hypothetical protein
MRAGAYRSAAPAVVPENPVASEAFFPKAFFPDKNQIKCGTESTVRLEGECPARRLGAGSDSIPLYRFTSSLQEQKDS